MFPGKGSYTYNNGQSDFRPENSGYERPQGAPPGNFGNLDHPRYSRPSYPPPSPEDGYERPNVAPPSFSSQQGEYTRPSAPPPQMANSRNNGFVDGPDKYQQPSANMSLPPQSTQSIQGAPVTYQYSQCNGRRKALLIGINYFNSQNQLRGCINDAHNMFNFLTTRYGYRREDIVMLTDDQQDPIRIPTRDNIIRAMQWLVKNAQPNDSLFFHYSGHGGQTKDLDGDEEDGMDDVIYPVDFERAGDLVDDIMHDIMVKPLQPGVRLTALFDSCHSGTVLDLPYTYSTKGVVKEPNVWKDLGSGGLQAAMAYATGNRSALFSSLGSLASTVKNKVGTNVDRERIVQTKFSPADIIMFSGSKDNQTSADAVENGQATGAMSYAFVKVLGLQSEQSYLSLLQNMRQEMASKYSQKPQLSSSHPIDVNLKFIL
ncbi:hypothetical protein HG535_0A03880 [Zygotorulaspora mrakii]|uniref:Metacaspase-1 n=1 Tax=Zygotorulaspora mrakii TaxID=42260 RepID=A0A7H9AXD4_ZYGMR|nr:uncharacterized protein HG535_0A03880 [Zygotorulaspora mrakii]QLG70449.1 hypothetical protein HG535_0A03880 [Zygotorulaspora mrakii]